ncbi:phosphatidylglycerol lysyltransferase domain-containing protein [Sediminibacillus albus]|uniref:Phosphatidylglycerol lysyltransferase n=1 Tax=Sediminibacillus albus TaxID=407036 RepID=A0A1G8WFW6_9BACI|nr:phosphatidylglycerol lysyltransferase domain-containing protein [Sediminibacillus albus]SDJ77194.1 phosphatidylglycerol lysyltransferase [Sediminibacillus albus]
MKKLEHFLNTYKGNHLSHLLFLEDKNLFWAKENKVLIAYQQVANRLVVLGDPIGERTYFQEAIKEFEQYADRKKSKAVYYQVSSSTTSYLQNHKVFKLGEEATVDLNSYSISGKYGAKLRNRRNKFNKQGYQFQVVNPPHTGKLLKEIEEISDEWLSGKKEKGFSVSFFKRDYVALSPIGTLRNPEGKLIAFVTLGYAYKDSKSLIVDLMRYRPQSPHGTMDMLIISILSWAKDEKYEKCSLGMCPLSNVGKSKEDKIYEKVANLIYEYVKVPYNFKGLREYKRKFSHSWEARYLIYSNDDWLPSVFLKLYMLINRSSTKNIVNTPTSPKSLNYKNQKVG